MSAYHALLSRAGSDTQRWFDRLPAEVSPSEWRSWRLWAPQRLSHPAWLRPIQPPPRLGRSRWDRLQLRAQGPASTLPRSRQNARFPPRKLNSDEGQAKVSGLPTPLANLEELVGGERVVRSRLSIRHIAFRVRDLFLSAQTQTSLSTTAVWSPIRLSC